MAKLCQKVKSKIQKRSNFNDFHLPKAIWLSLLYSQKDTRMIKDLGFTRTL
jgi:hypothetical protein